MRNLNWIISFLLIFYLTQLSLSSTCLINHVEFLHLWNEFSKAQRNFIPRLVGLLENEKQFLRGIIKVSQQVNWGRMVSKLSMGGGDEKIVLGFLQFNYRQKFWGKQNLTSTFIFGNASRVGSHQVRSDGAFKMYENLQLLTFETRTILVLSFNTSTTS